MASPLLFSSIVSAAVSGIAYTAYKYRYRHMPTERRRLRLYNETGPGYDSMIHRYEVVNRVLPRRKKLMKLATGHILEIAAGTGRNFHFFDPSQVKSITVSDNCECVEKDRGSCPSGICPINRKCIDFSRTMLRQAQKKQQLSPVRDTATRFFLANVIKLPFPDECFDTLIDTHGLCSYERPVETFGEALRTLKIGGKILLLEHGASSWPIIPLLQDGLIERHAYVWGCFNTRSIPKLLDCFEELEVDSEKSWRFGTHFMIVATKTRPSPKRELKEAPVLSMNEPALEEFPFAVNTYEIKPLVNQKLAENKEIKVTTPQKSSVVIEDAIHLGRENASLQRPQDRTTSVKGVDSELGDEDLLTDPLPSNARKLAHRRSGK